MLYKKIKVSFKEFPTRLNRIMYVRADIDLFTFGVSILTTLEAAFEHYFYFQDQRRHYYPENFEDLFMETDVYMTNFKLTDLSKKFILVYDSGEGWEFEVKVSAKPTELRSRQFVHLIEGEGLGLWEDNIHSLSAYLNGEIAADETENNEEKGHYLPWNIPMVKYGDFDQALDINEINETIQNEIELNLSELEENDYF